MGLEQDKENELFNIIILIANIYIYVYIYIKCRLKANPPNRFLFEKIVIVQRMKWNFSSLGWG